MSDRARCPNCRRPVAIRRDGTLHQHNGLIWTDRRCSGSFADASALPRLAAPTARTRCSFCWRAIRTETRDGVEVLAQHWQPYGDPECPFSGKSTLFNKTRRASK